MSCLRRTLPALRAAAAAGIGRLGSLVSFFRPPREGPPPAALPVLAASNTVAPLRLATLSGRLCRSCGGRSDERRGNWFEIEGRSYCRDCAPAAAQAAGLSLGGGAPPGSGVRDWRDVPLPTTLKAAAVRVGGVRVEGLAVYAGGRATGLSLVPEVKTTTRGVTVDRARWFVSYDRAEKPLAGPFSRVEAQAAAARLARFNWRRPVEAFAAGEVAAVKRILLDARRKVDSRDGQSI